VPVEGFDSQLKRNIEDYRLAAQQNSVLPGLASLTRFDFQASVWQALMVFALGAQKAQDVLQEYVPGADPTIAQGDVDYIVQKIAAGYELLK
jgi:hypothetical protein